MVFGVATNQRFQGKQDRSELSFFLTNFIILDKYVNSIGITCQQRGICYRY